MAAATCACWRGGGRLLAAATFGASCGGSAGWHASSSASTAGSTSSDVVTALSAAARRRGLDIAVGLTLQDYNEMVGPELALPDLGRRSTLAVLVGSTKTIWPPFLAALRAAERRGHLEGEGEHDGPLNAYVVRSTEELVAEALPPQTRYELRYAHEVGLGRLVAMQKLAHLCGAAFFHPSCGLNVHTLYGPWHAYRSLIIVDMDGVETAGPPPNPSSDEAVAAAEAALAAALAATVDPTATNTQQELVGKYRAAWRKWQKVRQALSPPAFDEWVYPDEYGTKL